MPERDYILYNCTEALCSQCLRVIQAKEIIQDNKVYLLKRCLQHGPEKVLIAEDASYWRLGRERFLKYPEQVMQSNTAIKYGCPYDCGICPDHEQHGCVNIVEITEQCNLQCPTCYAGSGPQHGRHRSLQEVEQILDLIVANEGEPDVVQISGGEPSIHPDFFAILDACKKRPIKHLMINTNGVRLAKEPEFAKRLSAYMPAFEVYLQFDSLEARSLDCLRGADLRQLRQQALTHLAEHDISTTLVVTTRNGLNDHEYGAIIKHAQSWPNVRGVTFQPVQDAGRNEGFNPQTDRLTLSGVRQRILDQSDVFTDADILPVPCHPDNIAMAYCLREGDKLVPMTRYVDIDVLLGKTKNTITFEQEAALRESMTHSFSTNHSPQSAAQALKQLLCCLPKIKCAQHVSYKDVFRIVIMQFMDRHSLDIRNARKSCVLIADADGKRMIPFDTFNILYRSAAERAVLEQRRAERLLEVPNVHV